jgi:hypothetical protein
MKLFPLGASGIPGLRVLSGADDVDALYDEFARLLVEPDALDPDSETAKQIAAVKARLEPYKKAEALRVEQVFQDSLLLPIDAGAALDERIAKALADARDRAADDAASSDS